MKTNMKQKIQNSKVNYSGNLFKSLLLPLFIGVIAIILTLTVNFNRGIDFNGGIIVSFDAGQEVNLQDKSVYQEYRGEIESILNENGVSGSVYSIENTSIVVKVEYKGNNATTIIKNIKEDLIANYYSDLSAEEIEDRYLVEVNAFGSSITLKTILKTFLATLICILAICIYIGLRYGLHSSIMTLLSSIGSMLFTGALIMVTRLPLNTESLVVIPFVSLLSSMMAFVYARKVKLVANSTDNIQSKSNVNLCNEAVKKVLYGELLVSIIMALGILLIGAFNMGNSVAILCLMLFEAIASSLYINIFVIPSIFALSYVRKVKKEKVVEIEQ